ncbi:MAG: hypothetical protein K0B11_04315 [Mariniphaga sp.]|nr:hypothetical protein [Mariniphaga sp.]
MKKHNFFSFIIVFALIILLSGCASMKTMQLNSIELTSQLRPGLSYTEVEALMGKPKSSQMVGEQWIARWNLQEMWRGYIPYDLVFNASDQTLLSWSENTQAFNQKQEQLKVIADELQKAEQASAASGQGEPSAAFENNQALMNYFEGAYYSFSAVGGGQTGGTERKLSLCTNGRYISSSESGYSGDAGTAGAWGTASQGGGGGTWKITGSKTAGTIAMTNAGGKTNTYKFETCGDGCIYIGNTKYAYAGNPECR